MHIDILSVVPELLESFFSSSILKRAIDRSLVEVALYDIRKYGLGKSRQVDDYLYGGGPGMLLRIEPIWEYINELKKKKNYDELILMSPDGEPLSQKYVKELSLKKNLLILCGHYKGVDQRVRDHLITKELSIGDYVVSGGELPAAILSDAIIRLLPGVLGDIESAHSDSFYEEGVLSPPLYTRPFEYKGWKVPEILLSGNFKEIEKWKKQKAFEITQKKRPDLLEDK